MVYWEQRATMQPTYCPKRAKFCYPTASAAGQAKRATGHVDLNIFQCPHCRMWHLGRPRRPIYSWRRKEKFKQFTEEYPS